MLAVYFLLASTLEVNGARSPDVLFSETIDTLHGCNNVFLCTVVL